MSKGEEQLIIDEEQPVPPASILVIDDEEIVHKSLRKILGREGHRVEAVLSATAGLEQLGTGSFELVITDLMMPNMDGIELLTAMKARKISVPVLMITGYPTIRTALEALRLGAVDYLAKPFTRQELLAPVHRALRRALSGVTSGPGSNDDFVSPRIVPAGPADPGIEAPEISLPVGVEHYLRKHSWAVYRQDGMMDVGVEDSFLRAIDGPIVALEIPGAGDLVEQGYIGIRLRTESGEVHGVFMPLSGQVAEVNAEAAAAPAELDKDTWLVRAIPSNLASEIGVLKKRER